MKQGRTSPGRQQYLDMKRQHPDALLLFRIGDFYETFDDDARKMAEVLDIALTARDVGGGQRSPLAGIPHHSLDAYLPRLIKQGLKVAIAEQVSDPGSAPGVVEREVVRIVTPGTVLDSNFLQPDRSNYLAAVVAEEGRAGLACVDLTTSKFTTSQLALEQVLNELERLVPSEVLVNGEARELLADAGLLLRDVAPQDVDLDLAERGLLKHYGASDLEAFGCRGMREATIAAFAALQYAVETQRGKLPQMRPLQTVLPDEYVQIDRHAIKDLELFESMLESGREAPSLFSVLNFSSTPLGARLLRSWIVRPLTDLGEIRRRQDVTEQLAGSGEVLRQVGEALRRVGDVERITNRLRSGSAGPRDLVGLAGSLEQIPLIKARLSGTGGVLEEMGGRLEAFDEAVHLIRSALADDPPSLLGEGKSIRKDYNAELDELKGLATNTRGKLLELERKEREATGIKSLKTGSNKVFGYYIEVSRVHSDRVPAHFERKQTLTGAERFVTRELKDLEGRILSARERINELEKSIFSTLCQELAGHAERIMEVAVGLAELDVLCGYAQCAVSRGWVRPEVDDSDVIEIRDGRHPIVEQNLAAGEFVPNDVKMSAGREQLLIITGPNMAGKSTYIRMVATLVLLAQTGSFIPAKSARIGITDRIFTRTGLSDDISGGRSTFMVEMVETATILNQATGRSLAVLDEIGRGTSTYDGLAIAQAVAEYVHNAPGLGCRTLFATHYHEMAELEKRLERVRNYRVEVAEKGRAVYFLRRIVPGGADRSYGVHVAQLAGMPPEVLNRAWQLLERFEKGGGRNALDARQVQLQLMELGEPGSDEEGSPGRSVLRALDGLEVDRMTPLEAINKLSELKRLGSEEGSDEQGSEDK